ASQADRLQRLFAAYRGVPFALIQSAREAADSQLRRAAIHQRRRKGRRSSCQYLMRRVELGRRYSAQPCGFFAAWLFRRAHRKSSARNSARASQRTTRAPAVEFLVGCESQPFWSFEFGISKFEFTEFPRF